MVVWDFLRGELVIVLARIHRTCQELLPWKFLNYFESFCFLNINLDYEESEAEFSVEQASRNVFSSFSRSLALRPLI